MLSTIDTTIIAIFLISTLAIGLHFGKKIKTMREYAIGNQNFTNPVLVSTIFATWIGGASTMGLAEKVFTSGIVFVVVFLGYVIANLSVAQFIAPKMRPFLGLLSVGEIMGRLYGKSARVITGVAGALLCTGQLGMQIAAIGYLFHFFLGISHIYGILGGCGIVVLYSALGGIRAVTYTDVFQFVVLIIAIPIICNLGLKRVGGFEALFAGLPASHLSLFPEGTNSFRFLFLLLIFAVPYLLPFQVQRLLMAKDVKQMRITMRTTAITEIPFFIMVGIIALSAYVLDKNISPELAFPYVVNTVLPMGLKGLAISGMLAVIMSTADSLLNSASIAIVHDVIQPLKQTKLTKSQEPLWTRMTTLCLGTSAMLVSLSFSSLFDLLIISLNCWSPVIVVPLYAGIFGIKANPRCFIFSASAGLSMVVVWKLLNLEAITGIDNLIPSIATNGLVFFASKKWIEHREDLKFTRVIRLIDHWHNTQQNPHRSKPLTFLQRQKGASRLPAVSFAIFAIASYIIPYFMWSAYETHPTLNLFLRVIGGILCASLLFQDSWNKTKPSYCQAYCSCVLMYCLPFLTTYMLLDSQASILWGTQMALSLFLLAMLVDWLSFVILLPTGIALAWCFYSLLPHSMEIQWHSPAVLVSFHACVFAVLVGILFARYREQEMVRQHNSLKLLSGAMAHELRTPLSGLSLAISGLARYLPELVRGYSMLQQTPGFKIKINHHQLQAAKTLPQDLLNTIRSAHTIIDMMLVRSKDHTDWQVDSVLSLQDCVKQSLNEYPFLFKQCNLIDCNLAGDDKFLGNEELFKHVMFNLLKNSIYQIRTSGKGRIRIWVSRDDASTRLHFKDTATGIAADQLPYIFEQCYSGTNNGTGIGLAFCKMVMNGFGGDIVCQSVVGEYAEFILTFPKVAADTQEKPQEWEALVA